MLQILLISRHLVRPDSFHDPLQVIQIILISLDNTQTSISKASFVDSRPLWKQNALIFHSDNVK